MTRDGSIKLAMIGLGNIAERQLQALGLQDLQGSFRLVGAHDKDPDKRKLVGDDLFCHNLEQLLGRGPDAVLISTPTRTHFELAKIVLERGHSVVLEKPATTSLKEFNTLVGLAASKEASLIIAFHTSFALDLLWFVEAYKNKLLPELGEITGFHCGFYDQYGCLKDLDRRFESLGGSWTDSGINALSVLSRLIDLGSIQIEEALLTRLQTMQGEIHGHVRVTFSPGERTTAGRGTIDTNWMLGFSRKRTHLYFADSPDQIILDHSAQEVLRVSPDGRPKTLKNFSGEGPRMVNQYRGVFKEAWDCLSKRTDNIEVARKIHEPFFKVPEAFESLIKEL